MATLSGAWLAENITYEMNQFYEMQVFTQSQDNKIMRRVKIIW